MISAINPLLAFVAGSLTILSPCVLPLVPVVMGSAAQRHRHAPLALAGGLVLSFTAVGFLLAATGAAAGASAEAVRFAAAGLMLLVGLVLLIPAAQRALTAALAPLANWANRRQQGLDRFGLAGQAMIGALLGLVWTPCVGPTLGAATALAASGQNLGAVAWTMFAFALGIALVLVILATAAKSLVKRWLGNLLVSGSVGKIALGGLLTIVGVLILTGSDHLVEGYLLALSPDWLVRLTTSV